MDFNGKNILITGASAGIGYEIAKQLSKENCNITLLARRKHLIDELADNLNSNAAKVISVKCDVTNKDEVKNAFEEVKNSFNKIDIAILNAGVSYRMDVDNFDIEKGEAIIDTNLTGLVYCVSSLLPEFKKNRSGIIVGISSLAEARGFPKSGIYSATKAAATKYLESLRIELKKYNVKVIMVKPGFVKTAMTDKNEFVMPFLMDVKKAAEIIINGIRKEKTVIQFPFPIVLSSKLLKILPNRLFDFLLSKQLPKK